MDIKLPLFIVTGASGSGKTYVIKQLRRLMPDYDIFDRIILSNLLDMIGRNCEIFGFGLHEISLKVGT